MKTPSLSDASHFRGEAIGYSLQRSTVFAGLPERELLELAETAVVRSLDPGDYLFRKDDVAPGLYLVRRGIINFHRIAADGREIAIHFYREGEMLVEIASGAELGCPADARAVVPSEVIIISRKGFLTALRRGPELALRLFSALGLQSYQVADALEDVVSRDAAGRFMRWLLRRCADGTDAVEVRLDTTKRALANELGVRQETLSRTLHQLTDSGFLRVDGRRITIWNPRALQAACPGGRECADA